MDDPGPEHAFLGLPLIAEQEAEIQHFLHALSRRGLPCDTQELQAMLVDMLQPPAADVPGIYDATDAVHNDAERATLLADDCIDPISACEERIAAREGEAMKHP